MTNPTEAQIETALYGRMTALDPQWTTKLPGIDFKPSGGPWQRGTWMPGDPGPPVAFGAGAYHRQGGIYQIDLFYPKSERRTDLLLARAAAMRAQFYPENGQGLAIDAGGGQLLIDRRPFVSGIDSASDAAFNRVWIDVHIRIELPPG